MSEKIDLREDILEDSGYKSRKFLLTVLGLAIIGWGFWLTPWSAMLPPLYPTFVGAVLGVLGLYFGVNAGHALIASKTPPTPAQPPSGPLPVEAPQPSVPPTVTP
jgi:hypothetical protein